VPHNEANFGIGTLASARFPVFVRRRRDCRAWSAGKRARAVLPERIVEKGYGKVGEARNAGAVATLANPTALFILRPKQRSGRAACGWSVRVYLWRVYKDMRRGSGAGREFSLRQPL